MPTTPDPKWALEPSILFSIMKRIGLDVTDNGDASFHEDTMQAINTALADLTAAGLGPSTGFRIENELTTWEDFIGESLLFENAKDYVYYQSRLSVDPPTAAVAEQFGKSSAKCIWLIKHNCEQNKPS